MFGHRGEVQGARAQLDVVYEDEEALAFMDIRPVSEGHTLVIPKEHYVDIYDTPADLLAHLHKVTKHVALAVKQATGAHGISIVQQNGKAAGQDIFHIHVHIIPRFEGHRMPHFSDLRVASRESLDRVAVEIRKHL